MSDCCCCGCCEHDHVDDIPEKGFTKEQKSDLIKIIIALAGIIVLKLIEPFVQPFFVNTCSLSTDDAKTAAYVTNLVLYGIDYLFIGRHVLAKAAKNVVKGKIFDENFLMVVATLGAVFLGIVGDGEFAEAVAVMVFYQLGEWFEGYAVGRSRKNITDLMDIRPDYANVESRGKIRQVDPNNLPVGTVIVVKPGEKVPIDGVVLEGESSLDTSALTGESVPRMASAGDEVISGCICETGVLKLKTTKLFGESTVSKILELVENASENKSQSEAFISRFARVYTPCVCIAALCLALLPTLALTIAGQPNNWFDWVYRALTFLVISCPCALVISIPLSFFAGIGCASKNGVLIKGSNYLEALAKLDTVVFDKTGTLTKGVFSVVEINVPAAGEAILMEKIKKVPGIKSDQIETVPGIPAEVPGIKSPLTSQNALLYFAAAAESASSHPIAKSICAAFEQKVPGISDQQKVPGISYRDNISEQHELSANGVSANVGGVLVKAGKLAFVCEDGARLETPNTAGSIVYVSLDGVYAGSIVISDVLKETSKEAISALKAQGLKKTVMLTGDNESAATFVAGELGLDEVHANLLPEDKVNALAEIQKTNSDAGKTKEKVAFVGDGINDAPVLMRADVGVAMGAMGSDAAIEAADIVLMDDNPLSIPKSMRIARKCMRIVNENIVFALFIKFSCLVLGAIGLANMYMAIFADVGVMIIAVLNAMRALKIRG